MAKNVAVFLCAAKRTPIGSFQGSLSSCTSVDLGVVAAGEVLRSSGVPPEKIDEIILGCVLTAGLGQAPARPVGIKAGLPQTVQAMTINKVCSSGLKAVMLAAQSIQLGASQAVIAGGMESMSRSPYILPGLRNGARLGHVQAEDTIIRDGLWDVYNDYHMGSAAELCAREYKLTRDAQDDYALQSYRRALDAIAAGHFRDEIVPVPVREGKSESLVTTDEEPGKAKLEKIPQLKPVFEKDGTVTAANASSLNDGAAAMIVCSDDFAKSNGLTPLARLVDQGWAGQAPEWFTTAPVKAVQNVLAKTGLTAGEIDLFEINEAFSAVALACVGGLGLSSDKVNVSGGAVALGHPIGASGARILTTLLYALKRTGGKRGIAAICNGGGEATAVMVERV